MMLLCLHLEWKLKLQGTFFYFISFKVFSLFAYSVKFIFACVFLSFSLSLSLCLCLKVIGFFLKVAIPKDGS